MNWIASLWTVVVIGWASWLVDGIDYSSWANKQYHKPQKYRLQIGLAVLTIITALLVGNL